MRVFLALTFCLLAGCQPGASANGADAAGYADAPTEDEAWAIVRSLPYVRNGSVRLLSLTKTNGAAGHLNGFPVYQMAVAVEWECAVPHGRMIEVDRMAEFTCAHYYRTAARHRLLQPRRALSAWPTPERQRLV